MTEPFIFRAKNTSPAGDKMAGSVFQIHKVSREPLLLYLTLFRVQLVPLKSLWNW